MGEPDWELTATTVYCETVDDEVTLIVYADGTATCTGRQKYARPDKKKTGSNKARKQECEADCSILSRYRDSLLKSQR